MFWLFLIFIIPLVLFAISYYQLKQTTPDENTANLTYYGAAALQLLFTGYFVIKGYETPEMKDLKLPNPMPQMSMR